MDMATVLNFKGPSPAEKQEGPHVAHLRVAVYKGIGNAQFLSKSRYEF